MTVLLLVLLFGWLLAVTGTLIDLRRRPVPPEVRVLGEHARIVRRPVTRMRRSTPHRARKAAGR